MCVIVIGLNMKKPTRQCSPIGQLAFLDFLFSQVSWRLSFQISVSEKYIIDYKFQNRNVGLRRKWREFGCWSSLFVTNWVHFLFFSFLLWFVWLLRTKLDIKKLKKSEIVLFLNVYIPSKTLFVRHYSK